MVWCVAGVCFGVVYVFGVGSVLCARQPFFDEEHFAVLFGKESEEGVGPFCSRAGRS